MMPSQQRSIDAAARRRLEALFDGTPVGSFGGGAGASASQGARKDNAKRLNAFLDGLVIEPAGAAWFPCAPDAASKARADARIADWKTYLPADCIKAMVDDGWQWSTG